MLMPFSPEIKHAATLLISEDRLREALDLMLAHTLSADTAPLLNLSGQLAAAERNALLKLKTHDQLVVERNQLRDALLKALEATPPATNAEDHRGLRFKRAAFWLLAAIKTLLLLLILFHFSTSGYGQGETLTLIGLLMPVWLGYLAKAVKTWNTPGLPPAALRNLSLLKGAVWLGFPLYVMALCWILNRHPAGDWAFETARNWLIGIEAAFGGIALFVVNTLFEEK